jgi:hypothetical protein
MCCFVKVFDALCVDVALKMMMNACVRVFLIGQIVSMQMGRRCVRPRGRKSKALVLLV